MKYMVLTSAVLKFLLSSMIRGELKSLYCLKLDLKTILKIWVMLAMQSGTLKLIYAGNVFRHINKSILFFILINQIW